MLKWLFDKTHSRYDCFLSLFITINIAHSLFSNTFNLNILLTNLVILIIGIVIGLFGEHYYSHKD